MRLENLNDVYSKYGPQKQIQPFIWVRILHTAAPIRI
jgi:hypothetical protein